MAKIFSLGTCLMLLVSLFAWPMPVSAGLSEWSAETIPSRTDNVLGPPGIDIRDFAIGSDGLTVYVVPGDSVIDNIIYKSIDGGETWITVTTPFRVDLIAIAPDDDNLVVIANNSTPIIYYRSGSTFTWQSLGTVQENPGGAPPVVISDLVISPLRIASHYIAVAGKEAGNIANLWYFDSG
ncbi:MAG: beta propeller repeat protein, partial [Dehalococcoidales bacterium]